MALTCQASTSCGTTAGACCGHTGALTSLSANQTLSLLQQQQRFQIMSNQKCTLCSSSQNHRRNSELKNDILRVLLPYLYRHSKGTIAILVLAQE